MFAIYVITDDIIDIFVVKLLAETPWLFDTVTVKFMLTYPDDTISVKSAGIIS